MTVQTLGERLKKIRQYLGYTQQELADVLIKENAIDLNYGQTPISRIETGKGGDIRLLLILLNFYSRYVYIDFIFSDNFEIIGAEEILLKKRNLNSIIAEKMRMLKLDINARIDNLIEYL